MSKKKRTITMVVVLLLVLLLGISVGYAFLQSTLSISGSSAINNSTWDIHWNNVQITDGSIGGALVTKNATIDSSRTTVDYQIKLNQPGDFYEFTVDAVNSGTIDGMVGSVVSKVNGSEITALPSALQYSVKYADGLPINPKQKLVAGATETYKVRVEFKRDIEPSQLPSTEETYNLNFSVAYQQADSTAVDIRDYVYRSGTEVVNFGSPSSALGATYTNAEDMISNTGKTVFLRHKIKNGVITVSEVGFIYEGNEYYLIGGVNESSDEQKPIFTANVETMNSTTAVTCNAGATNRCMFSRNGVSAFATNVGQVYAFNNDWRCDVLTDGTASCRSR